MRNLFLIKIFGILAMGSILSQAPGAFNYQCVIRDDAGMIMSDRNITLAFDLIQNGSVVYRENHLTSTNEFGLVNLKIGRGDVIGPNDFEDIDWSMPVTLDVFIDINGGTDLTKMGNTELLSVPYALYADDSGGEDEDSDPTNELQDWNSLPGIPDDIADGDDVNDADSDPNNELQDWNTLPGIPDDIADGDDVNDADSDPNNELQDWNSLPGIPDDIADGDDVNDADSDPNNELQDWNSLPGIPDDIADGDDVNDADSDPNNELQSLSISGDQLSISGGNTITVPAGMGGDNWGNQTVVVDNSLLGNGTPGSPLSVDASVVNTDAQTLALIGNELLISNGNAVTLPVGAESPWEYIGATEEIIYNPSGDGYIYAFPSFLQVHGTDDQLTAAIGGDNQGSVYLYKDQLLKTFIKAGSQTIYGNSSTNIYMGNKEATATASEEPESGEIAILNDASSKTVKLTSSATGKYGIGLFYDATGDTLMTSIGSSGGNAGALSTFGPKTNTSTGIRFNTYSGGRRSIDGFANHPGYGQISVYDDERQLSGAMYVDDSNQGRLSLYSSGLLMSRFAPGSNYLYGPLTSNVYIGSKLAQGTTSPDAESGEVSVYNGNNSKTVRISSSGFSQEGLIQTYNDQGDSVRTAVGSISQAGFMATFGPKTGVTNSPNLLTYSGPRSLFGLLPYDPGSGQLAVYNNDNAVAASLHPNAFGEGELIIFNEMNDEVATLSVWEFGGELYLRDDSRDNYLRSVADGHSAYSSYFHDSGVEVFIAAGQNEAEISVGPQFNGAAGLQFLNGIGSIYADIKNFRMKDPEKSDQEIWYASLEGPEAGAYERGTAKLVNGECTVSFSDHFRKVINEKHMTVMLTPLSAESLGMAVIEKTSTGFKVKELHKGTGNYQFDWEVKSIRKGYENYKVVRTEEDLKTLKARPAK